MGPGRVLRALRFALLLLAADAAASPKTPASASASKKKTPTVPKRAVNDWYNSPPVVLSRNTCRLLYLATSVNPALSVIANEYSGLCMRRRPKVQKPPGIVDGAYRAIFYFARLRPRLLFVIGAVCRALQCVTVIELVFDPSIGVGAGLNLLALGVSSQWPAPLVFGWAISKPVWKILQAEMPNRNVRVPIGLPSLGV